LALRDKRDEARIGRPERGPGAVGAGEWHRRQRIERPHPQHLVSRLVDRDEGNPSSVGGDREPAGAADRTGGRESQPVGKQQRRAIRGGFAGLPAEEPGSRPPRGRKGERGDSHHPWNRDTRPPHREGGITPPCIRRCDPAQLAGEIRRTLPALVRVGGKAGGYNPLEIRRKVRANRAHARRFVLHDSRDDRRRRLAAEGGAPRHHLEDHSAEREDVGARISAAPFYLFGREVWKGSDDVACLRERRGRRVGSTAARRLHDRSRQPEIDQLGAAPGQHDVARLEIAVDDAGAVRARQRIRKFGGVGERVIDGEGSFAVDALLQRLAVKVLHHQVADGLASVQLANVVQRADVGVADLGDRARLSFEAFAESWRGGKFRPQHLDRYGPIEARVTCLVDAPHAAGPEGTLDFVGAQPRAGRQTHVTGL
jgi:hypothetical protein